MEPSNPRGWSSSFRTGFPLSIRSDGLPRIEGVTQAVPDQVEGQGREEQGEPREDHQPGREPEGGSGVGEHAPHDGVVSGTPTPRNDNPASNRMLLGMISVV